MNNDSVSYIPLGGVGDVTKNMHLYIYRDEILIVDCGMGFADNTMPGVDLLIPDISFLKKTDKKIVGMVLTHGHEDHIGGLPFILPSLPNFPVYGTKLTAAFANEKLKDFGVPQRVLVSDYNKDIKLGSFTVSLTHVTHSILETSHPVIKTPMGIFYHGSDFKFDFTPVDGTPSDLQRIASFSGQVLNLASDCLGSERKGYTPSEKMITKNFEDVISETKGKVFVTTYSSNISRLNQAIEAAQKYGRKVCFIGRSFLKARDIGRELGYMKYPNNIEFQPQDMRKMDPSRVLILCAGSQGQPESGLMRIATDNDRDLRITKQDSVIFSSDPIPGNELNVYHLVDILSKKGAKVFHSDTSDDFHVSGHGSQRDLELLISLTKPQFVLPIGGTYRHMVAYRELARGMGYTDDQIVLPEDGQEIIFTKNKVTYGKKIKLASIYVDQLTGEQVDNFIVLDRQKVAEEGIVVVIAEVDSESGTLLNAPEIITRGFNYPEKDNLSKRLVQSIQAEIKQNPEQNADWTYYRKLIRQKAESLLFKEKREPLVIPVVLEV
jgi:ribonuclease J